MFFLCNSLKGLKHLFWLEIKYLIPSFLFDIMQTSVLVALLFKN